MRIWFSNVAARIGRENWKRSTEEVLGLMAIFARYIEREADRLAKAGVRMRFIGDRSRLDPKLQRMMAGIEARTAGLDRLNLTVAINYGGRDEIVRAVRKIAEAAAQGILDPRHVTEAAFGERVDTGGPAALHARDRQAFGNALDAWLARRPDRA